MIQTTRLRQVFSAPETLGPSYIGPWAIDIALVLIDRLFEVVRCILIA